MNKAGVKRQPFKGFPILGGGEKEMRYLDLWEIEKVWNAPETEALALWKFSYLAGGKAGDKGGRNKEGLAHRTCLLGRSADGGSCEERTT